MKDRDARLRVGLKRVKSLVQLARSRGIDCIAHVGALKRHHCDWAILVHAHGVLICFVHTNH
jgi:hypothetical protein